MAALVEGEDTVGAGEPADHSAPVLAVLTEAMQQHGRGRILLSPHPVCQLDLTDLHFLDVTHARDATREPAAARPLTCSPRADYLDQHAATE
ncbi:hypothetical protein [Streptomyces lydicamycinicus]|uniref:hypothetical protein n=1 Tax=Streptomyces lydicamycinicus TaxID=1546107 RepID=UPI003D809869